MQVTCSRNFLYNYLKEIKNVKVAVNKKFLFLLEIIISHEGDPILSPLVIYYLTGGRGAGNKCHVNRIAIYILITSFIPTFRSAMLGFRYFFADDRLL